MKRPSRARNPLPDAKALSRILRLEAERGFDNRAVTGGTHRVLLAWLEPAARLARSWTSRLRLQELVAAARAYPEMTPRARGRVIEAVRKELDRLTSKPQGAFTLEGPLTQLEGLGPRRAWALFGLGLRSVEDLLLYPPVRYVDTSNPFPVARVPEDEQAVLYVRLTRQPRYFPGRKASRVEAPAEDGTGRVILQFFNQPYRAEQLGEGDEVLVLGRARRQGERIFFAVNRLLQHKKKSETSDEETPAELVAEYRSPPGVPPALVRSAVTQALEKAKGLVRPVAPARATHACGLLTRPASLQAIHRPRTAEEVKLGRRSLIFEQLLVLQTRLLQHRARTRQQGEATKLKTSGLAERIEGLAGFRLTGAQRRVIAEIAEDLASGQPAYRLVHGDVGAGKTVVAAAALLAAVEAGHQAALMAPTEILAEQHALRLDKLLSPAGVAVHLLTGSLPASQRRRVVLAAEAGEPAVFVGTHALIQEGLQFPDLAVVAVDEQHRFGVAQRAALAAKGYRPHFLAFSATPIPRTLALALYADFDLSVLDELPPGRQVVETRLVAPEQRDQAYEVIKQRVAAGQQAFVICPLIEPSEGIEAAAAEEHFEALAAGPLAGVRLGLVHGRLATEERRATMQAFYDGRVDVLVSTTVIEVGLDVPRASVILIQSAERFGLAQLHQLRGRVARSRHRPLCMLVAAPASAQARQRLQTVVRSADGFRLAEEDLRLRGAGELTGLRQHGVGDWVIGDVLAHPDLLVAAQQQARVLLQHDPELARPEHVALAEAVAALGEMEEGRWAL
ncbi:MAG: ATP-dependent DNA helicase RecG [Armatimonadetes bacterium]|nr:ATP-dependent DNA helicase RecG [Armatimonadota bacterium]